MALLVILFFFGLSAGAVAKIRGNPFVIWFVIGFFLPGLGTIAAIVARSESDEPRRQCQECGTVVLLADQVCRRCGADLEWPEEALPSRAAVQRAARPA